MLQQKETPETKVETPEIDDVAQKEPQTNDEEVQKSNNGNKNLRKALIEANRRVAELEGTKVKSELPKAALDILREFSSDDDTANQLAEAFRLLARSESESLLTEKDNLTKAEKLQLSQQELETDQVIDDVLDEYRASGVKISRKELIARLEEEFGTDDTDYVEIPDERSIKLIAKLLVKEKETATATDAATRRDTISKTDALTNRQNATTQKRVVTPGRWNY